MPFQAALVRLKYFTFLLMGKFFPKTLCTEIFITLIQCFWHGCNLGSRSKPRKLPGTSADTQLSTARVHCPLGSPDLSPQNSNVFLYFLPGHYALCCLLAALSCMKARHLLRLPQGTKLSHCCVAAGIDTVKQRQN